MPVEWITHNGKRILYADYRGNTPEQVIETLELQAKALREAPGKVLVLANMTEAFSSSESMQRTKELGKEVFEPKMEKCAMVGITGLKAILLKGYNLFTGAGRNQKLFDSEDEAKAWLIQS